MSRLCYTLASRAMVISAGNRNHALEYVRETYSKNILHGYYNAGILSAEQQTMSGFETNIIKFSADSMIKNLINHPDISLNDYNRIFDIFKNPDKVVKINDYKIKLVKIINNRTYGLIIKNTKDKKENFLISYRYDEH